MDPLVVFSLPDVIPTILPCLSASDIVHLALTCHELHDLIDDRLPWMAMAATFLYYESDIRPLWMDYTRDDVTIYVSVASGHIRTICGRGDIRKDFSVSDGYWVSITLPSLTMNRLKSLRLVHDQNDPGFRAAEHQLLDRIHAAVQPRIDAIFPMLHAVQHRLALPDDHLEKIKIRARLKLRDKSHAAREFRVLTLQQWCADNLYEHLRDCTRSTQCSCRPRRVPRRKAADVLDKLYDQLSDDITIGEFDQAMNEYVRADETYREWATSIIMSGIHAAAMVKGPRI